MVCWFETETDAVVPGALFNHNRMNYYTGSGDESRRTVFMWAAANTVLSLLFKINLKILDSDCLTQIFADH